MDAANGGFGGRDFDHGSGPVYRMVIALDEEGVSGRNIFPNGQSALIDSPHFSDQAALWLGNETMPIWFSLDDVLANRLSREQLAPASQSADCAW